MAVHRVARAGTASAVAACLLVTACTRRDVFLVPGGAISAVVDAGESQDSGTLIPPDATLSDARPPECEKTRTHEQPQPLGVYVMVDQSDAVRPQWDAVSQALQTFIAESGALGGVSVGIQYYAKPPATTWLPGMPAEFCTSEPYVQPDVPISLLPGNQLALIGSILSHGPSSLELLLRQLGFATLLAESPTDGALAGAVDGASAWAVTHASERPKAVVLLVTTGIPKATPTSICFPDLAKTVAEAERGWKSDPSVATYVVGLAGPNDELDAIARAGGTEHSYAVTDGSSVLTALQNVRGVALPCDVEVSRSDLAGGVLNVELGGSEGPAEKYVKVDGALACDDSAGPGQWYPVDPGTGVKGQIHLCPNTCERARAVAGATLDVVLGCPTVVPE